MWEPINHARDSDLNLDMVGDDDFDFFGDDGPKETAEFSVATSPEYTTINATPTPLGVGTPVPPATPFNPSPMHAPTTPFVPTTPFAPSSPVAEPVIVPVVVDAEQVDFQQGWYGFDKAHGTVVKEDGDDVLVIPQHWAPFDFPRKAPGKWTYLPSKKRKSRRKRPVESDSETSDVEMETLHESGMVQEPAQIQPSASLIFRQFTCRDAFPVIQRYLLPSDYTELEVEPGEITRIEHPARQSLDFIVTLAPLMQTALPSLTGPLQIHEYIQAQGILILMQTQIQQE